MISWCPYCEFGPLREYSSVNSSPSCGNLPYNGVCGRSEVCILCAEERATLSNAGCQGEHVLWRASHL